MTFPKNSCSSKQSCVALPSRAGPLISIQSQKAPGAHYRNHSVSVQISDMGKVTRETTKDDGAGAGAGAWFNGAYPPGRLYTLSPAALLSLLSHTADEIYLKASQTECISRFSTSSEGVTLGTVCQWDTYGSDELSRVTKQENPGFRNALATLHLFQATVPLEEISYAKHPSPVTVAGPVDL